MKIININEVMDQARLTKHHIRILFICTLCMVIDGFDVQAISFVAPTLIEEWGIDKQAFGGVFGAGLLGMALGALILAPLADRFGRKPILIIAMLILSFSMFITMLADSIKFLIIIRFIAGFSLGAIVPNSVSLAGEYSPAKVRVTSMMIISSGFILGGVLGGAIASQIIPIFGWQSVFFVGAVAPLLLCIWMWVSLPESLQFLTVKQKQVDKISYWLQKLGITKGTSKQVSYITNVAPNNANKIAQLFQNGLAIGTILLWVILFMNLLATFFLANWLPILISQAGHPANFAVWAGATFWFGGLIGNLILGRMIDKFGFGSCLLITFVFGMLFIYAIGYSITSFEIVFIFIALAGFCILGAQTALNALAAVYYPTECRSTGAGWALGIGRLGSILGPVIGGILIGIGLPITSLFLSFTIPILIAAICIFIFWKSGYLPKTNH